VILWDARTYRLLHTLDTAGGGLLEFSPDGKVLVASANVPREGDSRPFCRWDVKTGKKLATLPLPKRGGLRIGLLSTDGRPVFTASNWPFQPRVDVHDAETGKERFPLMGHAGGVASVAFSPDGRTLASGGYDHLVRLWDLSRWKPGKPQPPCRVLSGHGDTVWSLAFSPDGSRLATAGSREGLLFLWDTATGRKVHELAGHSRQSPLVSFSPDGATLAASGDDGSVNLWDAHGRAAGVAALEL
jgi:WD40 repeat protein